MDKQQKILSLLPAATEMVYLLGLEKNLAGISDDCDYPASVRFLPKVAATSLPEGLTSRQIDNVVKQSKHQGKSIFHIDETTLQTLTPDIILTQELCSVCAPSYTEVKKAAKVLTEPYVLISLEPESIADIFANIELIATYTKRGKQAKKVIGELKSRLQAVRKKVNHQYSNKPSILIIEWFDPLMIAGHWVPQMIEYAGGIPLMTKTGERSKQISWEEIITIDPDYIIIAPCGFDINRTKKEISLISSNPNFSTLKAYKQRTVFLIDGNAYLTRPGPRIIDGIEILAEILYPKNFPRQHTAYAWQELPA